MTNKKLIYTPMIKFDSYGAYTEMPVSFSEKSKETIEKLLKGIKDASSGDRFNFYLAVSEFIEE